MSLYMKRLAFLTPLFFVVACSTDDPDRSVASDAVATGRIYASLQVVADGYGEVVVEAQLTEQLPPGQADDSDYFLHLNGGDELWLSRGDRSHYDIDLGSNLFDSLQGFSDNHVNLNAISSIREEFNFLFLFSWISEFGRTYSAYLEQNDSTEFSVSFTRDFGDDVYTSTVELPADFNLLTPLADDEFSRANDSISVSWDNTLAGVDIQISALATCSDGEFVEYTATESSDTGLHEIPAGAFELSGLVGRCVATVNVSKVDTLTVHPAFAGGVITGHQLRRVSFLTVD
jgi:hypothetical protein